METPYTRIKIIVATMLLFSIALLVSVVSIFAAQTVNLNSNLIVAYSTTDLLTGSQINNRLNKSTEHIIFDVTSNYEDIIEASEDAKSNIQVIPVGLATDGQFIGIENSGISIYYVPDTLTTYVLSHGHMFANSSCSSMFKDLTSLKSIKFNNFDTSRVTEMQYMFQNCSSLEELDLSSFDTYSVQFMHYMFDGCSSLKELDLSLFKTKNLCQTHNMFNGCSSLESLNLDNFGIEAVYNATSMFNGCSSLKELDLSSFKNSQLTGWYAPFSGCTKLETINLCNFETTGFVSLGDFFKGLSNLTNINMSKFDTSEVTRMSSMFEGCSKLKELDIGMFDTSSLTDCYHMFYMCENLETIYVAQDWNTSKVTNDTNMFFDCYNLVGQAGTRCQGTEGVSYAVVDQGSSKPGLFSTYSLCTGSNFNSKLSGATEIVFDYTSNYTSFISTYTGEPVSIAVNSLDASSNTIKLYKDGTKYLVLSNVAIYLNENSSSMFSGLTSLKSVTFNNINTSKVTYMATMFKDCSSLTSLDVSNFDTSNVTVFNSMFYGCSSLTELNLMSFNNANVTICNAMFYDCKKLAKIYVGSSWVAPTSNHTAMFNGCSALKGQQGSTVSSVGLTNGTYAKIDGGTSNPGYFSTISTLVDGVTFGNTTGTLKQTIYFDYALNQPSVINNRSSYTETFLDDNNLGLDNNGISLFYNSSTAYVLSYSDIYANEDCSFMFHKYTTGHTPNTTTTSICFNNFNTINIKIMTWMFGYCEKLKDLDLSSFKTSNVIDMSSMFKNCEILTSLDLTSFDTSNVQTMKSTFEWCYEIIEIDLTTWNTSNVKNTERMFYGDTKLYKIYVGDGWSMESVTSSTDMFKGTDKLQGGNGSHKQLHSSFYDSTYAYIGAKGNNGYLTGSATLISGSEFNALLNGTYYNTIDFAYTCEMPSLFPDCCGMSSDHILDLSRFTFIANVDVDGLGYGAGGISLYSLGYSLVVVSTRRILANENCDGMFEGLDYVPIIQGNNINGDLTWGGFNFETKYVKTMNNMFKNNTATGTLYMHGMNFDGVESMDYMFYQSTLTYISCAKDISHIQGNQMFYGCTNIIGENGTRYNSTHVDSSYAKLDETDSPGYFCIKS